MATITQMCNRAINRYISTELVKDLERRRKLLILLAGDMPPEPQKPRKPEPLPPVPMIQELIMVRMLVPVPSEECCDQCHRPVSVCGELSTWGGLYFTDSEICDECSSVLSMEE